MMRHFDTVKAIGKDAPTQGLFGNKRRRVSRRCRAVVIEGKCLKVAAQRERIQAGARAHVRRWGRWQRGRWCPKLEAIPSQTIRGTRCSGHHGHAKRLSIRRRHQGRVVHLSLLPCEPVLGKRCRWVARVVHRDWRRWYERKGLEYRVRHRSSV